MNGFLEKFTRIICLLFACVGVIAIGMICVFLIGGGLPAIDQIGLFKFLGGTTWQPQADEFGILPMICGTLIVTGLAVAAAFPLGVLCAVYQIYYCPAPLKKPMQTAISLMAGIPSVVYGFFGLTVIVPLIRSGLGGRGMSVLAAAILLALMILPTIASVSANSIRSVPQECYQGSLALGASHERSIFFSVLPAAKRGIFTSLVLGIGRAAGETMAVMMVAGNQPVIPYSILEGARTLTANIALEMGYAADLHRQALIATGGVLLLFILLINLMLAMLRRREELK